MTRINSDIKKILRILIPLSVSVVLIAWLFHKVNVREVITIVHQGVDYRFLVGMMVLTVLPQIFRGYRWGLQLRAAGIPRLPASTECVSIFGAYSLNLVFTYLGEAWRCVYISRITGAKVSTVVGTDLGDRGSDGAMIVLISIFAFFVARPAMTHFMDKYDVGAEFTNMFSDWTTWVILSLVCIALGVLIYRMRHNLRIEKWIMSAERIWNGFKVLFTMKGWPEYLLLTLGIWVCYFLKTYICFWAFPFTRELITQPGLAWGLVPGLVVFVFGSCSIAIPSNGGLGPWNLAVTFALTLYGVSQSDAATFSLVVWAFQSVTLIALGIYSAIYIMVHRHRQQSTMAETLPVTNKADIKDGQGRS